jgi:hypothetical protein
MGKSGIILKNRGPPRSKSTAKQAETLKQLDQLLSQGIIERKASYLFSNSFNSKPLVVGIFNSTLGS